MTDAPPAQRLPRWLHLTLVSIYTVLAGGAVWAIAQTQSGCSFLDVVPPEGILPGPQPCAPDATAPALVTFWIIAILLAAAFVVSFTVTRRRGTIMLAIAGVMLLVGIIGAVATFVAASTIPPIIYY